MVLADLLASVGVSGGVLLVVSATLAVYHLRYGIGFLSRLATWVQAAAVIGLIPGLDISVAVDRLWSAAAGVGAQVYDLVEVVA